MRTILAVICLFSASAMPPGQQQGPHLRAQIASIDYRNSRNIDDYLARCQKIRALIPALLSFYRQGDATEQRLLAKHHDDPQFVKMAGIIVAMNSLDKAGLNLLRNEMSLASEMSKLPQEKRQSFFDLKIRPLWKKEDALSLQEIQMARRAKDEGTLLPPDVAKGLSN